MLLCRFLWMITVYTDWSDLKVGTKKKKCQLQNLKVEPDAQIFINLLIFFLLWPAASFAAASSAASGKQPRELGREQWNNCFHICPVRYQSCCVLLICWLKGNARGLQQSHRRRSSKIHFYVPFPPTYKGVLDDGCSLFDHLNRAE